MRLPPVSPPGRIRPDFRLTVSALALCTFLPAAAFGQGIVADGRTATAVSASGAQTDITTGTVSRNHGVNTFSRFNVGAGQTVNIHVPQGSAGTINIVNGPRSEIHGVMRSVKAGQSGGALYFANPNGVVVGPTGQISAGSVSVSTPTQAFADGFIGPDGRPSISHVDQVLQGAAPQSEGGIDVQGEVSGRERVRLTTGGEAIVSGRISAGERGAVMGSAVNTGRVEIRADRGITIRDGARIEGMRGDNGGTLDIRSDGEILIESGASLLVDAIGAGHAGSAIVFGGDAAVLERGAVMSASALGDGDGGFVELSAKDTVILAGQLRAASASGTPGTIFIDPLNYTQANDLAPNDGSNIIILADNRITVAPGVTLSSRVVNPGADGVVSAAEALNGASTANSGNIFIAAPHIEVGAGANLVSHATGTFTGGDIVLQARYDDTVPGTPVQLSNPLEGAVSVTLNGAFLRGRDVTLDLVVSKQNVIATQSAVSDYAASLTDGTFLAFVDDLFATRLAQADATLAAITSRQDLASASVYVGGLSHVSLTGSTIRAGRDVSITANASTLMQVAPEVGALSLAGGASITEARIVIDNTPIRAGRDVTIASTTNETVDLNAFAGNVSTGVGDGSNAAAAVSARWTKTEVVIDADAVAGAPGLAIDAGGAVVVSANAVKDLSLEALVAADPLGRGQALTASWDKTDVRAALGGRVQTSGGDLDLRSDTRVTRAITRAVVGATADPVQIPALGSIADDGLSRWLAAANGAMSSAIADVTGYVASTGTGAFSVLRHDMEAAALFGGNDGAVSYVDPVTEATATLGAAGFDPGLDATVAGTAQLLVQGRTRLEQIAGQTAVRLGEEADAGSAVIAVLSSDVWNVGSHAEIGAGSFVGDSTQTVLNALTRLPSFDETALRATQTEIQDAFDSELIPDILPVAYMLPEQDALFDEDTATYITDVQVATPSGASVAISAGKRLFDLTTRAAIADGARLTGSSKDSLTVTARAEGGLFLRRALLPEWRATAGETRGVGGTAQQLRVDAVTEALVGVLDEDEIADDATEFANVTLSATDALAVVGAAQSYGAAQIFAINGAGVYSGYAGTAHARLDARNLIEADTVTITALDNTIVAAEAAAGQVSGDSGVGLAWAVVDAERNALAEIARADGARPGLDDTLALGRMSVLTLKAQVDGVSIASAAAGAKTAEEDGVGSTSGLPDFASWAGEDTVDLGGNGVADGGTVSIQAAADFASLKDTSTARAHSDSTRGNTMAEGRVTAEDTSVALSGAGAATSGAGLVGLGGAIARLDSDRTVAALIENGGWQPSNPSTASLFMVRAEDTSAQRVLGLGRAGDAPASIGQVYGSLAWLNSQTDVTARLDHAFGSLETINVNALRDRGSIAAAGALDPTGGGEDDEDGSGGGALGVGISVAVSEIDEQVTADLVLPPVSVARRIGVTADNTSRNWTLATSKGTSNGFTVAGSGIVGNLTQTTRANVAGRLFPMFAHLPGVANRFAYERSFLYLDDFASDPEFEVRAQNASTNRLWSGSDADTDGVSFGGAVIVARDTRETEALLDTFDASAYGDPDSGTDDYSDETPPEFSVLARHGGTLDVGQRAGAGESGSVAGEVSVTSVTTDWDTTTTLDNASLLNGASIDLRAVEEARLNNLQRAMVEASKGAGTIGVAVTTYDSVVDVTLEASRVATSMTDPFDPDPFNPFDPDEPRPATIEALSASTIRSKAVRSGAADGLSGAVAFNETRSLGRTSVSLLTGEYRYHSWSQVDGSSVHGGTATVSATDRTWREVVASAAGTSDATGIAGAIVHDVYERDTIATVNGDAASFAFSEIVAAEGIAELGAYSDTRATDIAIGRANGGATIGASVAGVLVKDDRDVVAQGLVSLYNGDLEFSSGGLRVEARRDDVNLLLQATELVVGSGGAVGIGAFLTGGRTSALVDVQSFGYFGAPLEIFAEDATATVNLALGGGQADRLGGTGAISYLLMGKPSSAAAALDESERGEAERSAAEDGRSLLGATIEDERGPNSGLFETSDVVISAALVVGSEAEFTLADAVQVTALDNRRGHAISGQMQAGVIGPALEFADKYFDITSVNASGFEIVIHLSGRDGGTEEETSDTIDTATDTESPEELGEAAEIAEAAGTPGGTGTSLGAAFSYLRLGGTVEAILDVAPLASDPDDPWFQPYHDFSGDIALTARSNARTVAIAAGATVSAGNAFAGAGAVARQFQYVHSALRGGGVVAPLNENALKVNAETLGDSWAIATQAIVGTGGAAGGATVAVNDLDAVTRAEIRDTDVTAGEYGGDGIDVAARNQSLALSAALSGGAASSTAAGLSVSYTGNKGITEAAISGARINRSFAGAPVSVTADTDLTLTSLLAQANIGMSNGIGAALSISKMAGVTSATVTDTILGPTSWQARLDLGNDLTVRATSEGNLNAAAVGAAGGGNLGISGSLAISDRSDTVLAAIDDSDVAAAGDVTVEASATGVFGAAGGGDRGILSSLLAANSNFTGAGSGAIGASVSITKAASDVTARIGSASIVDATGEVRVAASANNNARGLTLTAAGGGSFAVGIQVPLFFMESSVRALIEGDATGEADVLADGDVSVTADSDAELRSFIVTAAAGGSAGAGVDVEYLRLGNVTEARVVDAQIESAGTVQLDADSTSLLSTNSFALGGAGAVGLAGIVQVALAETDTRATLGASDVVAGGALSLTADAVSDIDQVAGALGAGGTVGIGGNVIVLNGRDTVRAEVLDASAAGAPDATTLDIAGAVDIAASATTSVDSDIYGIGGGTVGIAATIFVSRFEQTVAARLGNHATVIEGSDSLAVNAFQHFDQSATIGAAAGGFVGVGAGIGANSMANSVLAEIGRGASVMVSGDVIVRAKGIRDYAGVAFGAAGGALAFSGSVLSVSYGKPGETENSGEHMAGVAASMEDDDPYVEGTSSNGDMANGDVAVAAYFASARDGRGRLDLARLTSDADAGEDAITALIAADAEVEAGDDIILRAIEGGQVSLTSGAAAGGAIAATGGVLSMRRGSTLTAEVGAGALLDAGDDLAIEALVDVDSDGSRAAPVAFTGSGGLITVAGAVSRVVAERDMAVLIGEGARLVAADTATLLVEEKTKTRANAVGGQVGAIAVGGTVSFARHETDATIAFATSGARPRIDARAAVIENRRDGEVTATATAAQAAGLGISGVDTTAEDDANAIVELGRARIIAGDSIDVRVFNQADVKAVSTGVSVGTLVAQGSFATARRSARSVIGSAASVRLETGALEILAVDALSEGARSTVEARTISIAGSGIGSLGGGFSDATNSSFVSVDLILRELDVSGDARVGALSRTGFVGSSIGVTAGLAAVGANRSVLTDASETTVAIALDQDNDGDLEVGGRLRVEAVTDQDSENDVISGQGGLVGIAASEVRTDLGSNTTVALTSADQSLLRVGTLDIEARHDLALTATGDSYYARVAGAGGTAITTNVTTDADITFDGLHLEAEEIVVDAVANLDKASRRFDGQIGNVGVFSGSALFSNTTFNPDLDIVVRNSTLTQSVPGTDDSRGALFSLRGSYEGKDALKIDSGGAVTGAAADSRITVDGSGLILFDAATVRSDGDLNASVVTDADLGTDVFVNTFGLAGVPTGTSKATLDKRQYVTLANGAEVESMEGDVILAAKGGLIDVESEIRVFNGTALPITIQPVAESRLELLNSIDVGHGAAVLGAQDVRLNARLGTVDLYSYGTSSDYYREGAEAVVNFFGDIVGAEDVSLTAEVGRTIDNSRNLVTVDGSAEAGARHVQRLVVNGDGSVFIADEGVDYEIIPGHDPAEALRAYIAVLEEEAEEFAGDPAFVAQREAAIARLEQLLDDLGGETIDLVRVNDVFAAGGNVLVDADVLGGDGSITAHGDALIDVINESAAYLEIGDLVIPFRNGGELLLRGSLVDSNAQIEALNTAETTAKPIYNANPPPTASLDLSLSGPGGAEPTINVENRYIGAQSTLTGDLIVSGLVENLNGTARLLTAEGNLYVLGEVNARTVDIRSGGDFFLVAAIDDYLTNVDDPYGVYAAFFDDVAAGGVPCGYTSTPCSPAYSVQTGGGRILGVGGVYIYANALNVNGTIQSGITDWDLNISEGFGELFDTMSLVDEVATVYAPAGLAGYGSSWGNEIDPATGQPYVTGNGILRYDRVNRRFIVDPMITKGGTVELVGDIISTGGGEILAAHGHGRVNVVSDADVPIHFTTLSTGYGEGVNGLIRIVDTALPGVNGGFVTTEFSQAPDGTITRTVSNQVGGLTVSLPGLIDPQYTIAGDWAVETRIGEVRVEERITRETRVTDPQGNQTISTTVTTNILSQTDVTGSTPVLWDERALKLAFDDPLLGGLPPTASATPTYEYLTPGAMRLLSVTEDDFQETTSTGWVGDGVTDVRETTVVQKINDYALHTIPANLPIDIGFHGYDVGELKVTARGDVILEGGVYNRAGLTEIVSTEGSILTDRPTAILDTDRLILNAGGEIGQLAEIADRFSPRSRQDQPSGTGGITPLMPTNLKPLKVDVADGFGFTALAQERILVEELSGDINVIAVDSAARKQVELTAPGSILRHSNAPEGIPIINAGDLSLTARGGSLGKAATLEPLWITADRLNATAADEIALYQSGADLQVDRVASAAGDVTIVVSGGSIRDANSEALVDRRAEQGLLEALWDELGLRGNPYADGTENTRDTDALEAYENARTAEYRDYWRYRIEDVAKVIAGDAEPLPYDPAFVVEFDEARRDELAAFGLDDAAIAAAEKAETEAFHAAHAIWGAVKFDPTFTYEASQPERDEILGTAFLSDERLGLGLRRSLILPVSDTVTEIETANVSGVNITLMADLDVGESTDPVTFLNADGFTEAARLALWTAERADISIVPDVSFTVAGNEDLDVEASGRLRVLAGRDAFVGSESPVALQTLFAGDDARLKTSQGITGAYAGGTIVNATGRNIVLEGGEGGIGAPLAPILVAQAQGGSIAARAEGDVRIATVKDSLSVLEVFDPVTALITVLTPSVQALFEPGGGGAGEITQRGSLAVSDIYSGGAVVVSALGGDILDANLDAAADIRATDITLSAGGAVGSLGNPLEVASTQAEAAINAVAVEGDLHLSVTEGDVVAHAIGSVQANTRLTVAAGDLRLAGAGGIPAINAGGQLVLSVAGTITGKDGIALDLAASDANTIAAGGQIGAPDVPLVTRFRNDSLTDTAWLSVFDIAPEGAAPVSAWFLNDGDLRIVNIALDEQAASFGLINHGEVLIDTPFLFDPAASLTLSADRINIAALGDSQTGSRAEIRIEDNLTFAGSSLNLLANGRVWVADGRRLDLGGAVTIDAEGFRMDDAGPLAKTGSDPLVIRTEREIRVGDILAVDADVSLLAGDTASFIEVGDLEARSVLVRTDENTGLGLDAARIAADVVDIDVNWGIVVDELEVTSSLLANGLSFGDEARRVLLRPGEGLNTVEIEGGLGIWIDVAAGTPIAFDSLRTGEVDMASVEQILASSGTTLEELGIGPNGLGIALEAETSVELRGDGVVTNGAPVSITASEITQTAGVLTGGGDLSLVSTTGAIRQTLGAEIDTGTGSALLDSAGVLDVARVQSAASDEAIVLRTAGALTGVGEGPYARATAPDGRLVLNVESLANPGPSGFGIEAGQLGARIESGNMQLHAVGDLEVLWLDNIGGGAIDLLATGGLTVAGSVESGLGSGKAGPVLLTALGGDVTGAIPALKAESFSLHAFGGAIGSEDAPFVVTESAAGPWRIGAADGIWVNVTKDGIVADYAVTETGPLVLDVAAPSSITTAGGAELLFPGATVSVAYEMDQGETQETRPALGFTVVDEDAYRLLTLGATHDGGGDTDGEGDGGGDDGGTEEGPANAPFLLTGPASGQQPFAGGNPPLIRPFGQVVGPGVFVAPRVGLVFGVDDEQDE
ncbi:leukotoxin LktA family filamentous adhesin [Sinisalibacter lacisalsi]|uniref:Filamentous haemagglutinin FhaB/tRNA nuclease CdiA-like TPS domain-containing protein n=1 Tax=Sinisalibacter lacisalsi TaxID=1526570 RepID=A0ABQ1QBA5_9RHOB|nr:leukotoxin LktA family filamentous adhesin [Sinisalibacter lacisalsi]GGD20851.1 hypothetical protein GCM10011358_01780 [Sinisalibacter lacisalsi]